MSCSGVTIEKARYFFERLFVRSIGPIATLFVAALWTQAAAVAAPSPSQLRMVIVLSRHGVRSPTHPAELQAYAAQTWPAWPGKPGNLTEHGALLMQQFGAYYRRTYGESLAIGEHGCPPAGSIFVWADIDQRTRATGDAVLAGLAPGCNIPVHHRQRPVSSFYRGTTRSSPSFRDCSDSRG